MTGEVSIEKQPATPAIEFEMPSGSLVSPDRPAPVDSYGYVGVALIELVITAMARVGANTESPSCSATSTREEQVPDPITMVQP